MESRGTDRAIGLRVRALRARSGLTLDQLASRSGVSRAMISRVERGESSPTAALLGRLCAAFGIGLSALFHDEAASAAPLVRHAAQPVWTDPGSGYVRRDVAPSGTGSPIDVIEVDFPPAASVAFDNAWTTRRLDQHVWVLDGTLELTVDETVYMLHRGDCLYMRLDQPIRYRNPTDRPVRYAVILNGEARRG